MGTVITGGRKHAASAVYASLPDSQHVSMLRGVLVSIHCLLPAWHLLPADLVWISLALRLRSKFVTAETAMHSCCELCKFVCKGQLELDIWLPSGGCVCCGLTHMLDLQVCVPEGVC